MRSDTLFVSGSSSGIGTALIERTADNYSHIFAHYHSNAAAIENLQIKFGDKIILLKAYLSDYQQTIGLAERCGGGVSHFVHIPAAPVLNAKFSKTEWWMFEKDINISLRSAFLLCKPFLPQAEKLNFKIYVSIQPLVIFVISLLFAMIPASLLTKVNGRMRIIAASAIRRMINRSKQT